MVVCPGCKVELPDHQNDPPDRFNASGACWQAFSDLESYTVSLRDPEFIHQHVVDTYAAQHAGGKTRNITVIFGLIGLYLTMEKEYTGKEVQRAHMLIAKKRKTWPPLDPPEKTFHVTVADVLRANTDSEKKAAIHRWMTEVWEGWADRHEWIRETTETLLFTS